MRFRAILVVLLVVTTAGCSSFGGEVEPDATVTPAPVPPQPSTPDDPRVGVAPGVAAVGITHPSFLAATHLDVANGTSYVWDERYVEVRRLGDSTANVTRGQRIVVENESVYRRDVGTHEAWVDGENRYVGGYGEYADGTVKYTSWLSSIGDGREFERNAGPPTPQRYATYAESPIEQYLTLDTATVYRTSAGDRETFVVNGTRSSLPSIGSVENYSARAVIREDGFVRSLNVSFTYTDRSRTIDVRYEFAYDDVGSATVTPPNWAAEARAEFDGTRSQPS